MLRPPFKKQKLPAKFRNDGLHTTVDAFIENGIVIVAVAAPAPVLRLVSVVVRHCAHPREGLNVIYIAATAQSAIARDKRLI